MSDILLVTLVFVVIAAIFVAWIGSIAWAVGKLQERRGAGGPALILVYLAGPLSPLIVLLYFLSDRTTEPYEEPRSESYTNPDDAFEAAMRLDQNGEWSAAVEIYHYSRQQWPEHATYIDNCLRAIEAKQQVAGNSNSETSTTR